MPADVLSLAREVKLIRSGLPINELIERSKLVDKLNKQFGDVKNDIKKFERVSKGAAEEAKKATKNVNRYQREFDKAKQQFSKDFKRLGDDINKKTKPLQDAYKKLDKGLQRVTKGLDKFVNAAGLAFGIAGVAISFMALFASEANQKAFDKQVDAFQADSFKQGSFNQLIQNRFKKLNEKVDATNKKNEKTLDYISQDLKRARSIADEARKMANNITYEARVRLQRLNDTVAQANSNASKALVAIAPIKQSVAVVDTKLKNVEVKATKAVNEAQQARVGVKLVDSKATLAQQDAKQARIGVQLVDSKATTALVSAQQLPAKIPAIVQSQIQPAIAPVKAENIKQDTEIAGLKTRVKTLENAPKVNSPTTNTPTTNTPVINQAQINQAIVNSGIPAKLNAIDATAQAALKQSTAALNKPELEPLGRSALGLGTNNAAAIDRLNQDVQQLKAPNLLEPRLTTVEAKVKERERVDAAANQKLDQLIADRSKLEQILIASGGIALMAPAIINNLSPKIDALPGTTAAAVAAQPCNGRGCGGKTAARVNELGDELGALRNQVNGLPNLVNAGNAVANTAQLRLLNTINGKLGSALPNGGIGGILSRLVKSSAVDKALQVMTFIGVVHNAYFLSANLAQSLFSLSSSAINATLRTMGITTADDTPIDVGQIISGQVQDLIKKAIGVETWNQVKRDWAAINRIYQAGANIIWSVQAIADSTRNITEYIAENTGKIGNALKRFRVIGERAFPDMAERVNGGTALQRKFDNFAEGVSTTTEGLSMMDSAFQEVISINDSVAQLQQQRQEFKKSIEESQLLERPVNLAAKARRDEEKAASKAPETIADVDRTATEVEEVAA